MGVVMVLGVHRSGTSCVAGMLSHLGLPMGSSWRGPCKLQPTGYFEDVGLCRIRRVSGRLEWPEDRGFTNTFEQRVALLRAWRQDRGEGLVGGKLPAMGMMVREMNAAWHGDWRAVVTERPFADSAKSQEDGPRGPKYRAKKLRALSERRDADLAHLSVSVLRIAFTSIMRNPALVVAQLTDFIALYPTSQQVERATRFVNPTFNHHTKLHLESSHE